MKTNERRDGFAMEDERGIAERRNRSITDSIIFAPTAHSHEIEGETLVHVDQLSSHSLSVTRCCLGTNDRRQKKSFAFGIKSDDRHCKEMACD
jgi:hypothetical protein